MINIPHSIKTPDGLTHTPLNDTDLVALVEEYAGREVATAVQEMVTDATTTLEDELIDARDEISDLRSTIDDLRAELKKGDVG